MSNFNTAERKIAGTLSKFPILKKLAKLLYSRVMYVKNKKNYKIKSISDPMCISVEGLSSFFGYYDKSPVNQLGHVLVCLTSEDSSKLPHVNNKVNLVVIDSTGHILLQTPVNTFNWQQGCRAHWLDEDLFIFNDFDEVAECYVCRVFSVTKKQEVKSFTYPVQDSFNTDYFISLNYQRLLALRPDYGYRNLPKLTKEELNDLANDGLWKIDYQTGEAKLLISIADACKLHFSDDFNEALHKLNHVMISPDGSEFIFMHRYSIDGERFDRLLLADARTGELTLLSEFGMVSHCFWADRDHILGYMRGPGKKNGYWLVNIRTKEFQKIEINGLSRLGDGHPHVHGDFFVTDTYPDKSRMQHLLLCNWKTGSSIKIGEFFHGFMFNGESRCDLHPRFSQDGNSVFFDSVFSGQRQLYKINIEDIK